MTSGSTTTRLAAYPTTSNRITSLNQNAATFRTYAYDTGGNISTDTRPGETYVFTYNKRNRLSSLTRNAVAYATYGYNALAEMTTRSTSATGGPTGQVAYIYDLDGHLIAEATASSGVTTRDYLWLAANDNAPVDMPLAVAEAALLYMVHTDHLGRPIRMTDSTKATVFQAIYKPYGEIYSTSGTKAQNLRFPGQYFQIETGFVTNWHRHYDSITGRYTQPDPLGLNAGMNRFGYANASPFRYTDRTGLEVESTGGFNYDPPSPPSSSDDPTGICSNGGGAGAGGPNTTGPNGPTAPNAGPNWPDGPTGPAPTSPTFSANGGGGGGGGAGGGRTGVGGGGVVSGTTYQVAADDGTPGNNQAQNKQFNDIVVKLRLNKKQERDLHDQISGQNYGWEELLRIGKEISKK